MRLFFWRRKPANDTAKDNDLAALAGAVAMSAPTATVERSNLPTKPLAMPPIEVKDALLRYARDYLHARGARVRVEEEDVIAATFPNGETARYTTSLARARADEALDLLVYGGGALAALMDDSTERARVTGLRLATASDPIAIARVAVAAPLPGCGRCVASHETAESDHCDRCPLKEGRFVFQGAGQVVKGGVEQRADMDAVELTYTLVSSDRSGRRDEWIRLAFDCETDRPIEPLSLDTASLALAADIPAAHTPQRLMRALTPATARVAGVLDAAGAFLRLRSLGEYHRRLDDLHSTFERARREGADLASSEATYARELERLHDIYAISLEARLESAAFIASPAARVSLRFSSGSACSLWVDIGRGRALEPACASCGTYMRTGHLCPGGHLTCPACRKRHTSGCPACAGVTYFTDSEVPATTISTTAHAPTDALTTLHLARMTEETWYLFVYWLLEQEGFVVERADDGGLGRVWRGRRNDEPFVATAWRSEGARELGNEEVLRVAALGTDGARVVLIALATQTAAAREAATRAHVDVIDSAELEALLEKHGSAHIRDHEQMVLDRQHRVAEAISARDQMLAAVRSLEEALAGAVNSRRAAGRPAVVKAVATLTQARQLAQQAFLAWDTLLADWQAAFGDREARDGSLPIVATVEQLREQGQRAAHLADVLKPACLDVASTPGSGDLGYGAWRKAILEELTARCETLRWRLAALDPAHAESFVAAHDGKALASAEEAAAAATHAAARVAKAQTQLEARARLGTPSQ